MSVARLRRPALPTPSARSQLPHRKVALIAAGVRFAGLLGAAAWGDAQYPVRAVAGGNDVVLRRGEAVSQHLPASSPATAAKAGPGAQPDTLDGRVVIIDGDTVAFGTERIRIENIDAPETRDSRCERELIAGLKAKKRLAQLLRSGPLQIERNGIDPYRRTLARLRTAGGDVGEVLIREGLALPWRDGAEARDARLRHWCG